MPRRSPGVIELVDVRLAGQVSEPAEFIGGPMRSAQVISRLVGDKDREHFVVLHLSARLRVISAETVAIGTLGSALVHPREVFKAAILKNAHAIVCGHNHPSGDVTPSDDDDAIYRRLKDAGEILGIPVLDFLVVSGSASWSVTEPR